MTFLTHKIREQVLERDNYRCRKCGVDLSEKARPEIHHINDNNDHSLDNLMSFCTLCHPGERGDDFWEWLENGPVPIHQLLKEMKEIYNNASNEEKIAFLKLLG